MNYPDEILCRWTTQNQIAGHYAAWAIRQSPYPVPDNLELVIKDFLEKTRHLFDDNKMLCMTWQDIEGMVRNHINSCHQALAWNERKNGNQAPFGTASRYWKETNPDNDFIDLDALIRNIAFSVYGENAEFEEPLTSQRYEA